MVFYHSHRFPILLLSMIARGWVNSTSSLNTNYPWQGYHVSLSAPSPCNDPHSWVFYSASQPTPLLLYQLTSEFQYTVGEFHVPGTEHISRSSLMGKHVVQVSFVRHWLLINHNSEGFFILDSNKPSWLAGLKSSFFYPFDTDPHLCWQPNIYFKQLYHFKIQPCFLLSKCRHPFLANEPKWRSYFWVPSIFVSG